MNTSGVQESYNIRTVVTIVRCYYRHHRACYTRKHDYFGLKKLPKAWRIYRCCCFELYITSLFCWKHLDLELMKHN